MAWRDKEGMTSPNSRRDRFRLDERAPGRFHDIIHPRGIFLQTYSDPMEWVLITYDVSCDVSQLTGWDILGIYSGTFVVTIETVGATHIVKIIYNDVVICQGSRTGDGLVEMSAAGGSRVRAEVTLTYTGDVSDGELTATPGTLTDIDESAAGTYYSEWVDLPLCPRFRGLFSVRDSDLEAGDTEDPSGDSVTATVSLDIETDGDSISVPSISVVSSPGAIRSEGDGHAFFTGDSSYTPSRLRFKVVSTGKVYWTAPVAGHFRYYGGT